LGARLFFALTIAVVYQLARQKFDKRRALIAAILFGAAPACFWFSASTGTDIPSALAAALGMWGIAAGNGMLASAGFALAAQMRLELLILIPIVWLSNRVSSRWKWSAVCPGQRGSRAYRLGPFDRTGAGSGRKGKVGIRALPGRRTKPYP
jgi:4-amino-4-deoxy-L-arabinose transferase-like glycosyltransferase